VDCRRADRTKAVGIGAGSSEPPGPFESLEQGDPGRGASESR
jgi:hypothetical protein